MPSACSEHASFSAEKTSFVPSFPTAQKTTLNGFTDFSTGLRKTGHFPETGEGKSGNRLQYLLLLFYSYTLTPIFDRFIYIIR